MEEDQLGVLDLSSFPLLSFISHSVSHVKALFVPHHSAWGLDVVVRFLNVLLNFVLLGAVQLHRIGRRQSNSTVVLLVVHLGGVSISIIQL